MTFEYETHSNFLGIRPQAARLDSIAAPEFRKTVVNSSEECKQPIVVDMINVAFMDSSGLGALIACYKATQANGGLTLCNVHDDVKEVFTLTHMDRIFEIHDNYDSLSERKSA